MKNVTSTRTVPFPDVKHDHSGEEGVCLICGKALHKESKTSLEIRLIDGGLRLFIPILN